MKHLMLVITIMMEIIITILHILLQKEKNVNKENLRL